MNELNTQDNAPEACSEVGATMGQPGSCGLTGIHPTRPPRKNHGLDLRSPTEAALLEPCTLTSKSIDRTYTLTVIRQRATTIRKQQQLSKERYDMKSVVQDLKVIHFPQDETGKNRKISRPWHGP